MRAARPAYDVETMMPPMLASDLPLPRLGRGKVRDIYDAGDDRVLLVTTDRISAFDVVMAETIPHKGAVLTQTSAFWFRQIEGIVPHHMLSADADEIVRAVPSLRDHRAALDGRAMLCRRTTVFPIECVIRGYLSGSAWKEYAQSGTLAGEKLSGGLVESVRLEPAIFSPATKAETGHDENITIARMREIVGPDAAAALESMTRAIYARGEAVARQRGAVEVVVTDLQDATLDVARQMGATRTVNVGSDAATMEAFTADKGHFDVAFECSAAPAALRTAITTVRPKGTIVQVGVTGDIVIPLNLIVSKEISLKGTHRFHPEFAEAVRLIDSGAINVKPIITGSYPLDRALEAFEAAGDRTRSVKVHLTFA